MRGDGLPRRGEERGRGRFTLDPLGTGSVPWAHWRRFVACLAIKEVATLAVFTAAEPSVAAALVLAVGGVAGGLLLFGRKISLGALLLALALLYYVHGTWPFTLNHLFLEVVILGMIAGWGPAAPDGERKKGNLWPFYGKLSDGEVDGLAARMIWVTVLSVWFWSGMQKLLHGYYLDGEYLALSAAYGEGALADQLRGLLSWARDLAGEPPFAAGDPNPLGLGGDPPAVDEPRWRAGDRLLLVTAARGIVVTELLLPLVALLRRLRRPAVLGLLVAQGAVAAVSGEYDFALTGAAALLLATPGLGRVLYPVVAGLGVLLAGFAIVGAGGAGGAG